MPRANGWPCSCTASAAAPLHNTPTDPVLTHKTNLSGCGCWPLRAAGTTLSLKCLSEPGPRQHHRRLHDTTTHTHRPQEAVSTAKAKASHPHRGVVCNGGKVARMRVLKSRPLLTEQARQCSCHTRSLTSCAAQCTAEIHAGATAPGSCAFTTSMTAADLPGRHKPVQEKRQAGRRNEVMSVLWLAMSDTLATRSGKQGNSGRRPNLGQSPGPERPQRGSNPHCRLPRQPLAHTQEGLPHKQPISLRRHTSTTALVHLYKADRPRPAVGLVVTCPLQQRQ